MIARAPHRSAAPRRALALCAALCALSPPVARAGAQQLQSLHFSTDVEVQLGAAPLAVAGQSSLIGWTDGDGAHAILSLANQNEAADLDGLYEAANGNRLLSYDTAVVLKNGKVAHPADVILEEPPPNRDQDIFFDHTAFGISDAANVDAIAVLGESTLYLSFDATTVILPGQPQQVTAGDDDLVAFDLVGSSPPLVGFDGSTTGVPEGVGIHAAEIPANLTSFDALLVSFDVGGAIAGAGGPIAFEDEDVLLIDKDGWRVVWDGSANVPGIDAADVDAIAGAQFPLPTPTATGTATPTATPTATRTSTATATATRTGTAPSTATQTATQTATATGATATATATGGTGGTPTATPGGSACVGDCDQSGEVSISELIRGVSIALGNAPVADCLSFDANSDGMVGINELIQAVGIALSTCP